MKIRILPEAEHDLEIGADFYEAQREGLGRYFNDCLMSAPHTTDTNTQTSPFPTRPTTVGDKAAEDMPKNKKPKKKPNREGRLASARKWLQSGNRSRGSLIQAYMKRYGVSKTAAWDELVTLDCYDQLCIETYEEDGVDWEYRVEPLSGDMYVVPKGIEDHELYMIHPII